MDERKFLFAYDRRRTSTLTLDEQPGAHTGSTRKYIPGYSDANIIYRAPTTGSDSNDGLTELTPKQTKAACDTAAGTTKKIRIIEACTLNENIEKPTEMKRGVSGTIATNIATAFNTWSSSTAAWASGHNILRSKWFAPLAKFFVVGGSASSKVGYSADGVTFTESTTGFGSSIVYDIEYSKDLNLLVAVGADGKIETSPDGITWTTRTSGVSAMLTSIVYSDSLRLFIVAGNSNLILKSPDGITWTQAGDRNQDIINESGAHNILCLFADRTQIIAGTNLGSVYRSTDGNSWSKATITNSDSIIDISFGNGVYIAGLTSSVNNAFESADGITWEATGAAKSIGEQIIYAGDLGWFISANTPDGVFWSTDGAAWTNASPAPSVRHGIAYSPELGILIGTGAGTIRYCDLVNVTISADIAGFSVYAAAYSGTVTAYNCTLKAPSTTAALTLDGCRVNYDSHISNNAAKSRATLYIGDRHTTCTPAAQNDIDMNLDTVGGTWYIYNASQTGYERIRDCLVEGGIVANYPVTVSGRANTRGTSENVLFGATVTHNDPKFVDTTDYALQFQTNGYDKNSPAVGKSSIYLNSAGAARDLGAWSYVESGVTHFYAKSRYLFKGEISHGLEFNLTEQQGDSGVMNVYGNTQRIKEVLTIQYGSTQEDERAVFYEMLSLKDKGVKVSFAEWQDNTATVTVNGNQSADAEFLTVDAVQVFNGMTVTIAGKVYSVMRASPNMTAATKLILDRPTTDAVSDNDVLTTNYPSGQGEYQFSGPTNITMKQNAATGLTGWRTGFAIRLIRKYQG